MRKLKELVPLCVVNTARPERQSAITVDQLKEEGLLGVGDQPPVIDGFFWQPDLSEDEAKLSVVLRVLQQLKELGKPGSKVVVIDNDYHKCLIQAGWDSKREQYRLGAEFIGLKDQVLVYHVPTEKEKRILQLQQLAGKALFYPPNVVRVNNIEDVFTDFQTRIQQVSPK